MKEAKTGWALKLISKNGVKQLIRLSDESKTFFINIYKTSDYTGLSREMAGQKPGGYFPNGLGGGFTVNWSEILVAEVIPVTFVKNANPLNDERHYDDPTN
jgi:hypothetical protein